MTKKSLTTSSRPQQMKLFDDPAPATVSNAYNNTGDGTQNNFTGPMSFNLPPMSNDQLRYFLALVGGRTSLSQEDDSIEIANLNYDCYNLFVLENEAFQDGIFSINKESALMYTKVRRNLNDANEINRILNYPCVFAAKNKALRTAPPDCPVFIGKLKEIIPQGDSIKFKFKIYNSSGPMQSLFNDDPRRFGLFSAPLRNEMDIPHWAIKEINLKSALANNYVWR